MECHGILKASKSTNPVNYTYYIILKLFCLFILALHACKRHILPYGHTVLDVLQLSILEEQFNLLLWINVNVLTILCFPLFWCMVHVVVIC